MSLFIIANSCYEVPHFPDTPSIGFEKVEFWEIGTNTDPDSLNIFLSFEDGNGDLGLNDDYTTDPFHQGNYFVDDQNNFITLAHSRLPEYKDLLPPNEIPYSCINWVQVEELNGITVKDTLYYEPNPNHNNLFIDFLIKDKSAPSAEFELFDWVEDPIPGQCSEPLSLRFPVLDKDEGEHHISGTLKYSYKGNRIPEVFGDKILKLRIHIQDRALNKSNVVESQEFTLREIQVN